LTRTGGILNATTLQGQANLSTQNAQLKGLAQVKFFALISPDPPNYLPKQIKGNSEKLRVSFAGQDGPPNQRM